ncbi:MULTISPECIES: hypothetical protein [Acinetobacter]|uniref:Uncharacterized protein n=2 Tax=Acinetobacter TaxID=469 RepID=A0A4Q7AR37_9GAMM|nr:MULTISPECIES: hypothetical protein [Acinetobacter]MCW8040369.1 hypothetical protein [Acinetobacter entericus]RZG64584.1 hypothetical protein EXE25_16510 [Acinetobacter bouvetii]TCB76103.1 hypothetical protein E0H91_02210 [Acinetobacter sp. ANC 4177]
MKFIQLRIIVMLAALSLSGYAQAEAEFEKAYLQIMNDSNWAQVAEYQVRQLLEGKTLNEAQQLLLKQKQCLSLAQENRFYEFVNARLPEYQSYMRNQGFTKLYTAQKITQEGSAVQAKYLVLRQELQMTDYPCEQ